MGPKPVLGAEDTNPQTVLPNFLSLPSALHDGLFLFGILKIDVWQEGDDRDYAHGCKRETEDPNDQGLGSGFRLPGFKSWLPCI